jgi:hypothetical protein
MLNAFHLTITTVVPTPTKVYSSYKAPLTKGHSSYQARFQMNRNNKILLNYPTPERPPFL